MEDPKPEVYIPDHGIPQLSQFKGEERVQLGAWMTGLCNRFLKSYETNMDADDVLEVVKELSKRYWMWKLPDVVRFFRMAKFGDLGQVYGKIKPSDIFDMATAYDQKRDTDCHRIQVKHGNQAAITQELAIGQMEKLELKPVKVETRRGSANQALREELSVDAVPETKPRETLTADHPRYPHAVEQLKRGEAKVSQIEMMYDLPKSVKSEFVKLEKQAQ